MKIILKNTIEFNDKSRNYTFNMNNQKKCLSNINYILLYTKFEVKCLKIKIVAGVKILTHKCATGITNNNARPVDMYTSSNYHLKKRISIHILGGL